MSEDRPDQPVTVLYTANLRGDLAALPRLSTVMQRARQSATGPVFIIDLGDSCAAEVWECRATLGQAPLLVFDAMGYDAAFVGGSESAPIPPQSLRRVREKLVMATFIWGRPARTVKQDTLIVWDTGGRSIPGMEQAQVKVTLRLTVRLDRARPTLPDPVDQDVSLVLGDVPAGHVAQVTVNAQAGRLESAVLLLVPAETPADPTVAAVVELVQDEARRYAQEQGRT